MKYLYQIIGLLVLFGIGLFAFNRWKDSQADKASAAWQVRYDNAQLDSKAREDSSVRAALANAQSVPLYREGKERIIRLPANQSPETQTALRACFDIADARISACEVSRKADSATIAAKNRQIALLESKPEKKEKRLVLFGAIGYSMTNDAEGTRSAPAFRVGAENKLFGPIRIVTDVQVTMPAQGRSNPTVQGNIFARVNF